MYCTEIDNSTLKKIIFLFIPLNKDLKILKNVFGIFSNKSKEISFFSRKCFF